MIINTKKYRLKKSTYIRLALYNILRQQWWVSVLLLVASGGILLYTKGWWAIVPLIALVAYVIFWIVQFYGITILEQNQLLFQRMQYQINNQQIIMTLSSKQGMPIAWQQIQSAKKGKDYFLLFISKVQLIYLPYKIFNGVHEIKFLDTLLKRKKIILA